MDLDTDSDVSCAISSPSWSSTSSSPTSSTQQTHVFSRRLNPLLSGMQAYRLEGKLVDVNVKVGDQQFPAHRVVLMISSAKIEAMLQDPRRKECVFDQQFVSSEIINDLLDFFYIGKVILTVGNAKLLLMAAIYLDIRDLQDEAERFLAKELRFYPTDVLDWFCLSIEFKLKALRECSAKFIFGNHKTVFKEQKLLDFSEDYLLQLFKDLKKPFSNMIVNEAMFQLLIRWIKFDSNTRSKSFTTLLAVIPLAELSGNFLRTDVVKEEIVFSFPESLELVTKALKALSPKSQDSSPTAAKQIKTSPAYYLYCLGGENFINTTGSRIPDSVSRLDVTTGRWKQMSPMIYPRSHFCVANIGKKIYCFGGLREYKRSDIAQVFDTETNRWTQLRSMPVAREHFSAAAWNGYIYVSGGYDKCYAPVNSVHRYCVATNDWDSVAPMLEPRSRHKMVTVNDFLYAVGGKGNGRESIERYDPNIDRWKIVAQTKDFWQPTDVTVHKGKIYAFSYGTVHIFDPRTNTIQTDGRGKELRSPSVVSIGDTIWLADHEAHYVVDPYDSDESDVSQYEKTFEEYNPVTGKWKRLNIKMDRPRKFFQAVAIER